jgi:hypothetical protein
VRAGKRGKTVRNKALKGLIQASGGVAGIGKTEQMHQSGNGCADNPAT